jgi:ATP-dependent DNA helicase RecG
MAEKKATKQNREENESTESRLVLNATLEELDFEKIDAYLHTLDEQSGAPSRLSRRERLLELGMVSEENGTLRPIIAALLIFGKNVTRYLPQASMKLARFKGQDVTGIIIDRVEVSGTLDKIIEEAARFVLRNMRVTSPIQGLYREDIPEYPPVAVREAITNAVAHRDYGISGQKISIRMFDDRLEVESPGGLAGPVTLENLGKKRYSRNPLLARLMYELRLVEEMGTGILRMRRELAELGSAPPTFSSDSDSFTAYLPARIFVETENRIAEPKPEAAPFFEINDTLRPEFFALMRAGLNERQARGLLYARERGRLTNRDYRAINPDITEETARTDLLGLVDKNYLMKFGDKRGAAYLPR